MGDIFDFFKLVSTGLIMMLPLANPLTSMTLLVTLGRNLSEEDRKKQIFESACYVVAILVISYYLGHSIIHALSLSLEGIRIAGGIIILFIGFTMLFPKPPVQNVQASATENIAFVPLALPGTAGPGSMALVLSAWSQMQQYRVDYSAWVWWSAPAVVGVMLGIIFWLCLRSAPRVVKKMGVHGIDAASRVIGFLLICMGVQFCIDGVMQLKI